MKTLNIKLQNVKCFNTSSDLIVNITRETVSLSELIASSLPKEIPNFESFIANIEISIAIPEEEVTINSNYEFPEEVSNEECCISRAEEENQ